MEAVERMQELATTRRVVRKTRPDPISRNCGGAVPSSSDRGRISKNSRAFQFMRSTLLNQQSSSGFSPEEETANKLGEVDLEEPAGFSGKEFCFDSKHFKEAAEEADWTSTPATGRQYSVNDILRMLDNMEEDDTFNMKKIEKAVWSCGERLESSSGWQVLVDALVASAVDRGFAFVDLAVNLSLRLIEKALFQAAAYEALMRRVGELMTLEDLESRQDRLKAKSLCGLLGRLLVANWPSGSDSCAKESNQILFAVLSVLQTLLDMLAQPEKSQGASPETCAAALVFVLEGSGRKLWLKWPDQVDRVYNVLKPLIVNSHSGLHLETKYRLLDLYVKINDWPKASCVRVTPSVHGTRSVDVQTEAPLPPKYLRQSQPRSSHDSSNLFS